MQDDALNDVAPTVVGLLVTPRAQSAGPPLVVALDPDACGLDTPAWVKVTQVHTAVVGDAREQRGRVPSSTLVEIEAALAQVLGIDLRRRASTR